MDLLLQKALDLHEEKVEELEELRKANALLVDQNGKLAAEKAALVEVQVAALNTQLEQEKAKAAGLQQDAESLAKNNQRLRAKVNSLTAMLDKERVKAWTVQQVTTPFPCKCDNLAPNQQYAHLVHIYICADVRGQAGLQKAS